MTADKTGPRPDGHAAEPLALRLNDQLGLVVDAAVLDCWKANYGLEKTPAEIAAVWGNWAPSGAILALRAAVAEIERQRAELARCGKDNCMGRKIGGTTTWVTWEAREAAVAAERERNTRKPLTHMQIVMLWGHRSDGPSTPELVSFARLLERHHGIGA